MFFNGDEDSVKPYIFTAAVATDGINLQPNNRMTFTDKISIRWADIDANYHMRHSAYYDFGAQHRLELLTKGGLSLATMQQQHFGPVLFREECVFKKEIHLEDVIYITTTLIKMRADGSRFSLLHTFTNEAQQVCAQLTIDGAWIDTKLRKLVNPTPQIITDVMNGFPKGEGFVEV